MFLTVFVTHFFLYILQMSLLAFNVTTVTILLSVIIASTGFFVIKDLTKRSHFVIFALSILCVALGSISINNHNRLSDDEKKKPEVQSNYGYSIAILILSLLILIGSIILIHPATKGYLSF